MQHLTWKDYEAGLEIHNTVVLANLPRAMTKSPQSAKSDIDPFFFHSDVRRLMQ
jgi:hypothetical protein